VLIFQHWTGKVNSVVVARREATKDLAVSNAEIRRLRLVVTAVADDG
jgi:hypothetical protein